MVYQRHWNALILVIHGIEWLTGWVSTGIPCQPGSDEPVGGHRVVSESVTDRVGTSSIAGCTHVPVVLITFRVFDSGTHVPASWITFTIISTSNRLRLDGWLLSPSSFLRKQTHERFTEINRLSNKLDGQVEK